MRGLARAGLDEVGTVCHSEVGRLSNEVGVGEFTGLEDDLQAVAVGGHRCAHCIEHCGGEVASPACERPVGQHQVDLVGTVGDGLRSSSHHVGNRLGP